MGRIVCRFYALGWGPPSSNFAEASLVSAWAQPEPRRCPTCNSVERARAHPLRFEWEPPFRPVGDFVWPFLSIFPLVARSIGERLLDGFAGAQLMPAEAVPRRGTIRQQKAAAARELCEFFVTHEIGSVSGPGVTEATCMSCGQRVYRFEGISRRESRLWTTPAAEVNFKTRIVKRDPLGGIHVRSDALNGATFFRIGAERSPVLCTEPFLERLSAVGPTNIEALEWGDVI